MIKFSNFILIALIIMIHQSSFARKPAVEDFFGYVPKEYQETSATMEFKFNFSKASKNTVSRKSSNFLAIYILLSMALIPFITWKGLVLSKQRKNKVAKDKGLPDDYSNVTKISDYKKDSKQNKEDHKKAS